MLRAVFGGGLYIIWKNAAVLCLVRMEWINGNIMSNTRKPHKKGTANPSVHSELMVTSSYESREERKDAVMITGEG